MYIDESCCVKVTGKFSPYVQTKFGTPSVTEVKYIRCLVIMFYRYSRC